MEKKTDQKQFEVVREGLAWGRFGMAVSGATLPGLKEPFNFAAGEGEPDNGGLNPEEFLAVPWRILSMAITPYRYFDFTTPGVLKAAAPLFAGITLYTNHNADVENWKGFVQDPTWDDKNTPPGINALLVIDRTVDARLARGVEIKALRSASVTIWFEYERSHPDLRNFYDFLGQEVDGEIVRFVITKITRAAEVSIVWEGEDPFAKSLAAPGGKTKTGLEQPTEGGDADMKVTAALAARLGTAEGTELTAEELEAKIKVLLDTKQAELDGLKPDAKLGQQVLAETRTRAATLYKALKKEKAVDTFITGVIDKADLAVARALCEEYEAGVEGAAPLKCTKCGETLSRRSSQETEDGERLGGKRAEDYKL
jgi:hypothetical protein